MTLEQTLAKSKCIHFIGIGGSGIFPIVQIFHGQGYKIQGSDVNPGDTTALVQSMGIVVFTGHSADHIDGADMIIYSAAIMKDNPELLAAHERGIPVFERSIALGYLTRQYDNCICVSGTHGKTTTTAMLTHMLVSSGMDPSAVIGGKLPLIGGNGRAGKSDIMTCEACEFVDTFLKLSPDIAVILNVDEDHLDYFGSLEGVIKSFNSFASLATKRVIYNGDDPNSAAAVKGTGKPVTTFGFAGTNTFYADNLNASSPSSQTFDIMRDGSRILSVTLNVPGKHNVLNALAACAAALEVGMTPEQITESLPGFTGAGRRFEILGKVRGITIADDYAHHPAELKATLETAMDMGYRNVWAVFQPFTYSRTSILLDDFASALSIADKVVMSEIMGGREHNTFNIYTKDLADKIPGSVWFNTFGEIADHVMSRAKEGDLVITLGCGDVYKCAKIMLSK